MEMINKEDVHQFEFEFGEALCDSNNWSSNPYVIYGFARGKGYEKYAEKLLGEIKQYGYNAEAFAPDMFEDEAGVAHTDYYQFIVDVVNTIPEYNARWWANINELEGDR